MLPGIDDGSTCLKESVAMLQMASECGTTDIVASPHANDRFRFDAGAVESKIEAVRARCAAPRLHFGCDFHLSYHNVADALAHPRRYTINHGRYLLTEFPDAPILPAADKLFRRLLDSGIVPVITHPERNAVLRRQRDAIQRWVALGCLVQITADSLVGHFGRRARAFAEQLVAKDLAHIVASDAHGILVRTTDLRPAQKVVRDRFGAPRAEQLFMSNPAAVIRNEPVHAPVPRPRGFWRRLTRRS